MICMGVLEVRSEEFARNKGGCMSTLIFASFKKMEDEMFFDR